MTARTDTRSEAGPPRERRDGFFGAFRFSGRALGLVWSTNRSLTVALAVCTVAAGLLPAAMAWSGVTP